MKHQMTLECLALRPGLVVNFKGTVMRKNYRIKGARTAPHVLTVYADTDLEL
jgi:hypothetical protein